MDHYTLSLLDTHPALLLTIHPEYSLATDWDEDAVKRMLDTHPEPLFLICDIRQMTVTFDDLIAAVNRGARGQDPIWRHPRIRGLYFVSENTLIKMAVGGLNTPAFGNTRARVVGSVEDALADIAPMLAAGS